MAKLIEREALKVMIDVHKRADPYSPYGKGRGSFEGFAEIVTNPAAKRALWLEAARHWRSVMVQRKCTGEMRLYWRAAKFARIAVSSAHYA